MSLANTVPLVWMDLEMTGLNVECDRILEIATIVTDVQLRVMAEGPVLAIHQSQAILSSMDQWNMQQHMHSGLINRVQQSSVTEAEAEQCTLAFLQSYVVAGIAPLCGNSIWQDRRFLARYMPTLERYFHYRLIDVSTLKELAKRWAPAIYSQVQKKSSHLALNDIRDSIEELRYYHAEWLKNI